MTQPFWDCLAAVLPRAAAASHLLVGLDYDGTLTPLVDDPTKAILDSETRGLLQTLASRANTSVAVVSERTLHDIRNLVGLESLFYAGNHGFELHGAQLVFTEPNAARKRTALGCLAAALANGLRQISGAFVENKSLTISVHYRKVAPSQVDEVFRHVTAAVGIAPESFRVVPGHQVLEIRPQVDWHKGSAMRRFVEELRTPNPLTLFVGDDQTDEDAFASLGDGITIKVGSEPGTSARYSLAHPGEVVRLLQSLAQTRDKSAAAQC